MRSFGRRGSWPWWVLGVPLLVVGVALAEWIAPLLPACLFHERTGWWCPGCGATRSAMALREGEVWQALGDNVIFATGVCLGVVWLGLAGLRVRFDGVAALRWFEFRIWFLWVVLGAVLVFWGLRNLPGFEWLGPEVKEGEEEQATLGSGRIH